MRSSCPVPVIKQSVNPAAAATSKNCFQPIHLFPGRQETIFPEAETLPAAEQTRQRQDVPDPAVVAERGRHNTGMIDSE